MLNRKRKGRGSRTGSSICKCPQCGYSESHRRGVPCSNIKCPKCGTLMRGENCIDE